jgi:hypothetical protein
VLKEVAEPDLPDNEEEATSDTPAHKAARKRMINVTTSSG